MSLTLSPAGRTALWIGGGGFVGLAVGALATNPDRAISLSPVWLIALAVYIGVVVGLTRERTNDAPKEPRAPKPAKMKPANVPAPAPRAHLTPGGRDALVVRLEFPDVPPSYPAVMGRGEALHVGVRVLHEGKPVEGAAVHLVAEMNGAKLDGDGVVGSAGDIDFTLEPEGIGELHLTATAKSGTRDARATHIVSIVSYENEIERLFGEFRTYAIGVLGPEAHADTARELCDKLRYRAQPETANALLELARVYELVAYGERTADRRLYLAVLEQLMVLEQAELPDPALAREA